MNKRTNQLQNHIHILCGSGPRRSEFYRLAAQSLRKTNSEPVALRRAKGLAHILDHMSQAVLPFEILAGSHLGLWPLADDLPEFEERLEQGRRVVSQALRKRGQDDGPTGRWALMGRDHYAASIDYLQLQRMAREIYEENKKDPAVTYGEITGTLERHFVFEYDPEDVKIIEELPWFTSNHLHLKYALALPDGLQVMRRNIMQQLQQCTEEKQVFYRSCLIVLEAASRFIERYADTLRETAIKSDASRAAELNTMADICERIANEAPRSFREALQLVWMLHLISNIDGGSAMSLARFDQYMWSYYDHDLHAGDITREEARELIECMWLKINEPKMRTVQSITLGGIRPDGSDGANDLTKLCIEITGEVGEPYPNIAVRVHKNASPTLFQTIAEALRKGHGQPMLFNDDAMLKGLERFGLPDEHIREYYNMGCVEIMLAGMQPTYQGAGSVLFAGEVELVFKNGRSNLAGDHGIQTGDIETFTDFESFMQACLKQVRNRVNVLLENKEEQIINQPADWFDPYASCFVEDCIDKGIDICQGGARYNHWIVVNSMGLGTAVDAIAAIKSCVYDQKIFSLREVATMLDNDFHGYENAMAILSRHAPKFGNDLMETDCIAARIYETFINAVNDFPSRINSIRSPQMFSYHGHVWHGELTDATANGRRRGHPISDGMGPSQGKDTHGPTCLIRSVMQLDHSWLTGGAVFNMKLSPEYVKGHEGLLILEALLRSYIEQGGIQIQVNIINSDELLEAQKCPENYGHLVVRVAGFCERFVELDRSLQDEIIARTTQE